MVVAPFDPSSEAVAHSGGELRLLLGVERTAARMVHSLARSSLDIVVAAAAVMADIVVAGALLDRSPPADIRLAFHNIVMGSTSCAIRYLTVSFSFSQLD